VKRGMGGMKGWREERRAEVVVYGGLKMT